MAVSPWGDLSLYESRMEAINRVKAAQQRSQRVIEEFEESKEEQQNTDNTFVPFENDDGLINNNAKGNNGANEGFNSPKSFNQQSKGNFNSNFNNSSNMGVPKQNGTPPRGSNSNSNSSISNIINNFLGGGKNTKGYINGLKEQLGEVSKPLSRLLDTFDIDSEKLIIIMVMWILFNEKSDKTLLLALGYLLL